MKFFLTGSSGFIGFHLAKKLLERGDEVVGVDNLNDYYDVKLKEKRNSILLEFEGYTFHKIDISEMEKLKEVFDADVDCVINLAAQAGVRYSLENPFAYEKANLSGFLNILELCRHNNKRLVYASSSSVYGECQRVPFREDFQLDKPVSLYAATKKSNELMAYSYFKMYGVKSTGLRFFTVYGPYGRPDMALFIFVKNIIEGRAIDVYNNGEMKRDFTYVSDIVDGIVGAIDNEFDYEIFNLGRGEPAMLLDFIKEIENVLGKKAVKNMKPMQPGDVPLTYADVSKARRMLHYEPKVNVKRGIKFFIDWYKEYYDA